MDSERWRQIEELYHSALERVPEERGAFVEGACAGDRDLQREVESLLAYDTETAMVLDRPALEIAAKALALDQRRRGVPLLGDAMSRSFGVVALCCGLGILSVHVAAQPARAPVTYLNQAWSQEDREWYYNFSQGATVMSYDIFLNLELADSQELFRSDANSERYGLIVQPPSAANPDGLPIGISKTVIEKPAWKGAATGEFAGVTCAMCHNSELRYQGKRIRIDGGNNHALDYQALIRALDAAMQATLKDPSKFDRLASRLKATSAEAKAALRARLEPQAERTRYYAEVTTMSPSPWGPARIDAFSLIQNRVTANLPGIPENSTPPIAPVKPPFLWNAPQGLWTQWAAIDQDPAGRNLGETAGVYLDINLRAGSPAEGLFASNAAVAAGGTRGALMRMGHSTRLMPRRLFGDSVSTSFPWASKISSFIFPKI